MEIVLTDENFEQEVIQSELPCLVDFGADWCGPCRMVAPIMKSIAEEYQGKLKVGTVNVDQAPNTASKYGITSIPALYLFKNGQVVNKAVGAAPKEKIISTIKPYI
ncbi:MAG: thioredoxin [Candidatus Omnitrophica bacterium]|nr:thioredoxin [Candidatus Omnitrophota bacterium]